MTDDLELQNLWMTLQKKSWRVLAVVSATPKGASLEVANTLADATLQFQGDRPVVLDLRDLKLRFVDLEKQRLEELREKGEAVVVALSSPERSPAGVALARAADAALVVVRLGESSLKAVARTADEIGRERVVGAVLVKTKAKPKTKLAPSPRTSPVAQPAAAVVTQPVTLAATAPTVKIAAQPRSKN